ncbi:hypothetical protein ES702_03945 [subsurface metagenome]
MASWTKDFCKDYEGVFTRLKQDGTPGKFKCVIQVDGKNKDVSGFKTAKEAGEFFEKHKAKGKEDKLRKAKGGTFDKWLDTYIKIHVSKLRPGTQRRIKSLINKYLRPIFGYKSIEDIKPSDCREFYANRLKTEAKITANGRMVVLRHIFKLAISEELISRNPTDDIKKETPTRKEKEKSFISENRLFEFLNNLEEEWKIMAALAGLAGARMGESIAFKWTNFDFDADPPTITFTDQIQPHGINLDTKEETNRYDPLGMLPELVEILLEWKKNPRSGKEWLICKENGNPLKYTAIKKHWYDYFKEQKQIDYFKKIITEENKRPYKKFTFHNLKHSQNPLLAKRGFGTEERNMLTRHTKEEITIGVYGHADIQEMNKKFKAMKSCLRGML